MKEQRTDLKSFDMAQLQTLRKLRSNMYCGGNNRLFFDELEDIITREDYNPNSTWERMKNDDIISGEVWTQLIGYYRYKNTVHKYEYIYLLPRNVTFIDEYGHEKIMERCDISEHGHEEIVERCGCQQIRKIKEWYIFPNGIMRLCRKGQTHHLYHHGKPMYLISLKIWNHRKWKSGME